MIRRKFIYEALNPRDPMEIPLAVFDTIEELAEWAGVDGESIRKYLRQNARAERTGKYKYIRVLIELERGE